MLRKMESTIVQSVEKEALSERILLFLRRVTGYLIHRWAIILVIIGYLLGRATIVEEISPFAIPFLAVVYHLRRDRLLLSSVAVLLGSLSNQFTALLPVLLGMFIFIIFQKGLENWGKGELSYTPFVVFTSVLSTQVLFTYLVGWTGYGLFMNVVEASLSLILTLIFVQSLPLLTKSKRTYPLKNEELVCLVILLASVMTGTVGWMIAGLSVEHILSRYAILLFALAAGGAVGATVGVVTGIILSLANMNAIIEMSLLAFCGLLGGLLKEGRKIGVAIGLLIGTLLMGLYVGDVLLWKTLNESLVAIILFLLTPKALFQKISSFIPGTIENTVMHQDYSRRIRDVTAHKVEQFSEVFQQLSHSFSFSSEEVEESKEVKADMLLSHVAEKTCQVCFKKAQCWEKKVDDTYRLMNQLYDEVQQQGRISKPQAFAEWSRHCVKSKKVIEVMEQEYEQYQTHSQYMKKMKESRRLVADQLSGVSQVMTNFAKEIQKETEVHELQEQQVMDALEDLGLAIRHVDVQSLEEGNVHIDISQPACQGRDECIKVIAPLLSDIMRETIIVKEKECNFDSDGYCKMSLCSAQAFKIETGVANTAKGGGWLSGDNYTTMALGNNKYAIAISDGMGNGERAHLESNETLNLLQQILLSGIEETVAIKSINSVLSLRSTEEIFSTLDLAMIDLQTASAKFLKIGSTPSFIKRGERSLMVSANNLPMGVLQDIEFDVVSLQLKADDLLIMITDGIYDAPRNVENKDAWLKRMITEIETDDPQEIADILLEKVVRYHQGAILDDMTVVVAKMERNTPEWATIKRAGHKTQKYNPSLIS